MVRSSRTMTAEFVADVLRRYEPSSSHQHLATSEGGGFRNTPSAEQIEIDIAAAQHQAHLLAADFRLVLQGSGESRGAGALGKIMRICPIGSYRHAYLIVGHLHDARGALANDRKPIGIRDARRPATGKRPAALARHHRAGGHT